MAGQKVTCDACSAEFEMTSTEVKTERLTNDRTGMYFVCPACGTKFPFAGITEAGLRMRKELQEVVENLQKATDIDDKKMWAEKHHDLLRVYSKEVSGPYKNEEVLQ